MPRQETSRNPYAHPVAEAVSRIPVKAVRRWYLRHLDRKLDQSSLKSQSMLPKFKEHSHTYLEREGVTQSDKNREHARFYRLLEARDIVRRTTRE